MTASDVTVVTFNAPLFYVSVEFLSAFLCWLSAMLFRASVVDKILPRNLFRPVLFGFVGTLHFAHASAVLLSLDNTWPLIVNSQRIIQLVICWAVVLYFLQQRPQYRWSIEGARLGCLTGGTMYCLISLFTRSQLPSGIGTAACWLVAFSMYYERPKAQVAMPVSFRAFCLMGFLSHMVIALGSHRIFDGPFFLSNMIQVSQYGFLTLSLLAAHLFGYSADVWAQRQLLNNTRDRCSQAVDDIENTRKLINEAQSHISSTTV